MKMKLLNITVLLLLVSLSLVAQTHKEIEGIKSKRFNRIDMRHIGVGLETGVYDNLYIGPKLFYGLGTFRNKFNIDGGLKYLYCRSMNNKHEESISVQFCSIFCSLNLNSIRWNSGCMYFGVEMTYNVVAAASHKEISSDVVAHDIRIGNNHFVARGKIGARLDFWDINVYCDYNLAPAMNQKYIFESVDYNYDKLYASIHERYRIGISVSYFIPLK